VQRYRPIENLCPVTFAFGNDSCGKLVPTEASFSCGGSLAARLIEDRGKGGS
jgi:hypothetical protein